MSTARVASIRILVALAMLAIIGVPSARADKTLKWKFKAGDKFTYGMADHSNTLVDFNGVEIDISTSQIVDMAWEVKSTSDDGSAEVGQTLTRFQFTINSPFTGEIAFDSAAKESAEGVDDRFKAMLAPVLDGLVNQQIIAKINSRGEVTDVTIPKAFTEALAAGREEGEGRGGRGGGMMSMLFGGAMDEEALKRMVMDTVALLPEDAANEDATWKQQVTASMGPAAMITDTEYAYGGTEDRDGHELDKIVRTSKTTIELPEDVEGGAEFEISEQEDGGTVYFDATAGRTVESTRKVKMTIEGETEMGDVYMERERTSIQKLGTSDDLPKPAAEEESEEGDDKPADDESSDK